MIGIKIPKKKKESLDVFETFLSPKNVFFPYQESDQVLIKEKSVVKEGTPILKTRDGLFISASVSGKVFLDSCQTLSGKSNCLRIENNGEREETTEIPFDYTYSKTEAIRLLKRAGIIGLGGAGFPLYQKYDTKIRPSTIIINAVECEPYITADYVLTLEHAKEVVKTLHSLMKTFGVKEAHIAIKTHQPLLKEKLVTVSDKYAKIKVVEVPNLYPMGWERSLVRYIKHTDYEKIPLEKGIIVTNISTLYAIHQAFHHHQALTERIVTFTGENMKKPCNVLVKIGTPIKEVLEAIGGAVDGSSFVIGGPMMGISSDLENIPITPKMNAILALPSTKELEHICMRCGKCTENCPVKISPALIRENRNNLQKLKKLHPEKCISCGICSYICPAKINLRESVRRANEKLKGEEK